MSGHAILDSCHNCGAKNVELKIVSQSETSTSCGFGTDGDPNEKQHHHIHVTAACAKCVKAIWERS